MADGQVVIQVKSNAASAAKDFDKLDKSLDNTEKELKSVDRAADKADDSLVSLKSAAGALVGAFAVSEVLRFSKGLVDAASNAEETSNKFNVVFGSIRGEAELTANALASGYGLAADEAQRLLSDTGDLLTGFGFSQKAALDLSEQLNTLAVDLASFTNVEGGTERAAAALTSALFGETEAAKSLGIVLTQDVVKAKVKALEVSGRLTNESQNEKKAIATLALAYEQSKNAIGDFARSQESFANQTRILESSITDLKVEVGEELLPAFTGAAKAAIFLTQSLTLLFKEVDTNTLSGAIDEVDRLENRLLFLKESIADFSERNQTWAVTGQLKSFKEQLADTNVDLAFARDNLRKLQEQQGAESPAITAETSPIVAQTNLLKELQTEAAKTKIELQNLFLSGEEDSSQFEKTKAEYDAITGKINAAKDATKGFKESAVEGFDFAGSAADNFSRNATRSLLSPWEEGETAADKFKEVAINTIADILAEFIAAELKKQAVALVTAVLTGGSSLLGGASFSQAGSSASSAYSSKLASFDKNANGGAFSGGTKKFANGGAFTNGIVSSPTTFPMAGGKTGLMGEAGAEAIMPLDRDNTGRLGVQVAQTPVVNNIINNAPVQIQTVTRPDNQNDIIVTQVGNALTDSRTSQGLSEALSRNSQTGANAF